MNKNPIVVITGLAVASVAGIAGLTKDKWMASPPQQVASTAAATAPAAATPAVEAPAQPPAAVEAPAVAPSVTPVAEPSATVAPPVTTAETPAAQPAAEQPAAAVVPAAEPPATAEVPAAQPEAEQPVTTDAPATQPAAEQPAAVTAPAIEAPAVEQQTAAVQPEITAPAAETAAPAAVETVPAFDTVRVEKTGEAVIAGTAKAGSVVVVKLDGAAIGTAVANADGAFVVVPDAPLPAGSGALTIESKGKGDQLAVQSEQSVAVIIPAEDKQDALIAVVSPNEPTKILQKPQPEPEPETAVAAAEPADVAQPEPVVEKPAATAAAPKLVSIDAVDYDSTGNIVFSGQGQAGNTARVYVDNTHTGDAVIAIDGRWSFAGTAAVGTGKHSLRVDGINTAGKVLNRVEVPFFREETSKVAAATPAEPVVTPDAAKTDSEVAATGEDAVANATVNPQITDAAPPPPKEGRVVIQPGNNLWRISRVLYGSGEKYTLLYKANKDQIRDPDMIFPGQIFMTPDVAPKVDMIDPKRREPLKPEENAASVQ